MSSLPERAGFTSGGRFGTSGVRWRSHHALSRAFVLPDLGVGRPCGRRVRGPPGDTRSPAFESRSTVAAAQIDPAHTAPVGRASCRCCASITHVGTDINYAGDFFTGRLGRAADGGRWRVSCVPEGAVVRGAIAGITLRPALDHVALRCGVNVGRGRRRPARRRHRLGPRRRPSPSETRTQRRRRGEVQHLDAQGRYVGAIEPPVDTPPTDVSREQLRIAAGTVVELMLMNPVVVSRR